MTVHVKAGYCTLCRSRCGSLNAVMGGRLVSVAPDPAHPTGAALCAKGRAAPELLGSPRRLTQPLRRTHPRGATDPGWVAIGWDEALAEVAARLGGLRASHGAETVAFAVTTPSGTPMVDSFEWVERFVRLFGSPNLIYAVEICGWHKDYAHALTFGRGIGAPDYDTADTIVLWGHNPTRTWLAQATRVADARQRGATVVVVDPKRGGSGETADLWLPIRPGADGALAMGAIRHLLAQKSYDAAFVRDWTDAAFLVDGATGRLLHAAELWPDAEGFVVLDAAGEPQPRDTRRAPEGAALRLDAQVALIDADGGTRSCASVLHLLAREAEPYDRDRVAAITRLDPGLIDRFNALFAGAPRLAYHAWTGVGQHTNATATERAIATLYALTGAVDRAGGNLWTTAPPTRSVNDYGLLGPAQQAKALGLGELPLGPPSRGWITARDFARAALDGDPYRVRGLMSFGTNFVVSQGGSARNRAALEALEFHVHVDMFMNPTAENADIVLPASMPWDAEALEILGRVDTLVIDKTGTLTVGKPRLKSIVAVPGRDESELLRLAAGLERSSEHPLAAAIVSQALERGLLVPAGPEDFQSVTGQGVRGTVEGRSVAIGTADFVGVTGDLADRAEILRRDGHSVVFVAVDGEPAGLLAIADPIKPSAAEAIRRLREDGLRVVMLTGDNQTTAEAVARELGIDDVRAGVLPGRKGEVIQQLQAEGRVVAMAGDGINDAPALALAQVGIAMGTGTDVAIESAGVTLIGGDLRGIDRARRLGRATMRNIRQNLAFAFLYNLLGVADRGGVLYPITGLLLSPMLAGLAMTFSSVSVIWNASRLRRLDLGATS